MKRPGHSKKGLSESRPNCDPPFKERSDKKQFVLNIASNFSYFILNVCIGIWLVPFLIGNLGVDVYGLLALALSITAYVGLISVSLNSSVSRFLTIDLKKGDLITANTTFNVAFFGGVIVFILVFPLVALGSYRIDVLFNLPIGYEEQARVVFFLILTAFLVSVLRNNFTVSPFSYNRLDLVMLVHATELLTRVLLLIFLFGLYVPQLWLVGIAYCMGAFLALVCAIIVWRKITPALSVNFNSFRLKRFREMVGMSGWVLLNQVGALLFVNIDLIVINRFFGAESTGRYAAVLQWVVVLRSLSGMIAGVVTPMVFSYYARGEIDQIVRILRISIKFLGLAMAFPVGLLCGFSEQLLTVWLGPQYAELAPLMWLLVGHLAFNISVRPVFSVQQAYNKVRVPGIVTLVLGAGNLILAVSFAWIFDWGVYGVALAGLIALTVKNVIFTPLHGAKILELPWYTFLGCMLPALILTLSIAGIAVVTTNLFVIVGWFQLIISSLVIGIIYLIGVYAVFINKEERKLLWSLLPVIER